MVVYFCARVCDFLSIAMQVYVWWLFIIVTVCCRVVSVNGVCFL